MISSVNINMAFHSLSSATTTCGLQSAVSSFFSLDLSIFGLDKGCCCPAPTGKFGQCEAQFKLRFSQAKMAAQQQLTAFLGAQIEREGGDNESRDCLDRASRETRSECKAEVSRCESRCPDKTDRSCDRDRSSECSDKGRSDSCSNDSRGNDSCGGPSNSSSSDSCGGPSNGGGDSCGGPSGGSDGGSSGGSCGGSDGGSSGGGSGGGSCGGSDGGSGGGKD